jgi:quinol monooxygenase YgiN
MRFFATALCCAIMLDAGIMTAASQTSPAPAAPPARPVGAVQVVTYLEVEPAFATRTIGLLKSWRDASRKAAGAGTINVFQEAGAGNRFTSEENWNDIAAFEAHRKSDAATVLNVGLTPGRLAPPDTRIHQGWGPFKASGGTPASGVYVMTHIDVSPPQLAALEAMLKPFIEQSRAEAGVLRFELLQQILPRRNHTTLVETWASPAAMNAHAKASHAHEFRDKLGPILGALYDQRVYKLVR